MKYQQRPGIVITKICKRYVLIPTRAASEKCRQILPLSMSWAMTWDLIGKENDEDELIKMLAIFKKKPVEEICEELHQFCEKLSDLGFLIRVEDDA